MQTTEIKGLENLFAESFDLNSYSHSFNKKNILDRSANSLHGDVDDVQAKGGGDCHLRSTAPAEQDAGDQDYRGQRGNERQAHHLH